MTDDATGPHNPSTRTHTTVWIVIAVLGAAVVFTATLAVIQWRRAEDLRRAASARKAAASTAAQFGVSLYSYDYSDLAAARARVLRLATAKYAKGYDASIQQQHETITRLKARESAKPAGVFLTDVVGNRVAGVVILDTAVQSTAGNRASINYLDLALVREGSTWKVDTARPVTVAP